MLGSRLSPAGDLSRLGGLAMVLAPCANPCRAAFVLVVELVISKRVLTTWLNQEPQRRRADSNRCTGRDAPNVLKEAARTTRSLPREVA